MKQWVAIGLLVIAGDAQAQVAYRCQVGGKVTLQGHPCTAGAKQDVRSYDIPTDPDAAKRRLAIEAEMDRRNARQATYGGGSDVYSRAPEPQRARCEAAKRHRAATLEQVGLRRNFDLLRNLDEHVRIACSR